MTEHGIKVGMRVSAPNGWDDGDKQRPSRIGTVEELYGPNQWPRVAFDDSKCDLETCTPDSLTIIDDQLQSIIDYLVNRHDLESTDNVAIYDGECRCFGLMPNTDIRGWFFAGYLQDVSLRWRDDR